MKQVAEGIKRLQTMLQNSSNAVVFTGAGISTESGIPDFRSPGGLWTKYQPIEFQDFISSEEMRRESWRRKFATDKIIRQARPNVGHLAIASLYKKGKVSYVITQNIDGLHQQTGMPDQAVIELHGNTTYASCLDCGKRFELAAIQKIFADNEKLPLCEQCNGIIKTATISFGQPMPVKEMQEAEKQTLACDLFLAMGSSLVVYPAAGFPQLAKQNGAELVIINRDATGFDDIADLVLHDEIGQILSSVVDLE